MGRMMMMGKQKQRVERRWEYEWGREKESKFQGENLHDMQDQAE